MFKYMQQKEKNEQNKEWKGIKALKKATFLSYYEGLKRREDVVQP